MQIVHLTPLYYPHVGGIEKHLLLLNKELTKRGHTVTVITQQHAANLSMHEVTSHAVVHRMKTLQEYPAVWKKLLYKLQVWKHIWHLKKHLIQADIVQIHDVFWWILPILPFLNSKKIFITFHGYEGTDPPNWRQVLWHRIAAWYTHGNLCVGDFHRKWYLVHPTLVTYGAVEKLATQPHKKISVPSHSSKKSLKAIYIGRLSDDAGISAYLAALTTAQTSGFTIQLDVYGAGDLLRSCEAYCRQHNLAVKFLGAVDTAAQALPQYDIAFVSRYLAILEALQAKVPVIAHYNNQIKYDYLALAPFAPWISIVQNPSEIAQQLPISIKDSGTRNTAKKWADAQTWDKMADTYELLWQT